jgi:hypothetical protein
MHLPFDPYSSSQGFPDSSKERALHDEQDTQRAIEAYRFFFPTVSMESIFRGMRELGIEDGAAMTVLMARPRHLVLTANSDTPYSSGVVDLRVTGPLVIEMPAGAFAGMIDDHHQRWICDLGLPGPDAGRGGKYLVLPPGFLGEVPPGHHVRHAETHMVLIAVRAIPVDHDLTAARDALEKVNVYPLKRPEAVLPYIDISDRVVDCTPLRWETNIEYWRQLHAVLRSEPVLDEFRPVYGVLAALGIETDKDFAPDRRMHQILERAAHAALEQMRIEAFATQRTNSVVWEDRHWEWVGLVTDPNFETKDYLDVQARDRWFYQAICTSPAMFRRSPGSGSVYFLAAREQSGAYLDGANMYKLSVPQPVPASLFWSVTAYDARTRSQVQTLQGKASLGSLDTEFSVEADGTVEIYFGPKPPAGREKQWIQTSVGAGFFLYFRIYGPTAESLNGTWRLGDLTLVGGHAPAEVEGSRLTVSGLRSITTADQVKTRIGMLRFSHGIPTDDAVALVYDNLDRIHAVEAFLNSFQAASLGALRNGLVAADVRDNDVLLFSGLMDSRSLFLTANCDTLYFISILDLSGGPIVMDVPAGVLGVFDDMWFQWISDFGASGPDRGEGGRYLLVPRSYTGALPEGGFFVCNSNTDHVLVLGRAFLEQDDPAPAAARVRRDLHIYPFVAGGAGSSVAAFLDRRAPMTALAAPPPQRFIEGSGLEINTIPPNDATYYELLDSVVQLEPADSLNPELAGQFAALGIRKGKPFRPNARMRKILEEAAAIGNATARTLGLRARDAEGFRYYGDKSAWSNPLFVGGFEFLRPPAHVTAEGIETFPSFGARALNARTNFFYMATGVSPAMCMQVPGIGSQYLAATADSKGAPLLGAKMYKIRLPPNIPAGLFWSLTLYDNQTRSMLQTPQRFPRAGSQAFPTPAAQPSADGSVEIYIGPTRPESVPPGNWIQTDPHKGWFPILRLYSPLQPFFDKSWRPSEILET